MSFTRLFAALLLGPTLFSQVPDGRLIYTFTSGFSPGSAMLALPDVNADGFGEILTGDRSAGTITVFSGRDGMPLFTTAPRGEGFGQSATLIPDANGDGIEDLAIGAPARAGSGGAVYIVDPRSGAILSTIVPANGAAQFGHWMQSVQDFDGDQRRDFVVTDPGWVAAGSARGAVYIYSSRLLVPVLFILGDGGRFGHRTVSMGDRDGDGREDLVISAPDLNRVRVYSTRTAQVLLALSAPRPNGIQASLFGESVSTGDLTGDGVLDVVASFSQRSGSSCGDAGCAAFSGDMGLGLWTLNARICGATEHYKSEVIPDQDGDGHADVLVGFPWASSGNRVSCYSGATGGSLIFRLSEPPRTSGFGGTLAMGLDYDHDGWAEILIGSEYGASTSAAFFSVRPRSLAADRQDLSYGALTQQRLTLSAGAQHAGKLYWMLGTVSGISPGLPFSVGTLPLNPDAYFLMAYQYPNISPFLNFRFTLDAAGRAESFWQPLPGYPEVVGLRFDHAYAVIGPMGVEFVSNSVPLTITP